MIKEKRTANGIYRNIVILTGAGVSAESGVATFRDNDGLWEKHAIEDVATPEGFAKNPALVYDFYNRRRAQLKEVGPNAAHKALGRLQTAHEGDVTIVTQNVDDLHERGGASSVIHMHGELKKIRCRACAEVHTWESDCNEGTTCPTCNRVGTLRPDIVWFGEMPFHMDLIVERLEACDLFISAGTSGNVYPAAGFVASVQQYGRAHTIEVNLEPGEGAPIFAEHKYGKAASLLPQLVDELLGSI